MWGPATRLRTHPRPLRISTKQESSDTGGANGSPHLQSRLYYDPRRPRPLPTRALCPFLELGAVTWCLSSWGCERICPSAPGHLRNQLRPWELGPWAVEETRTGPGPPVHLQPRRGCAPEPFSPDIQGQRQPWSTGIFPQHSPGSSPGQGEPGGLAGPGYRGNLVQTHAADPRTLASRPAPRDSLRPLLLQDKTDSWEQPHVSGETAATWKEASDTSHPLFLPKTRAGGAGEAEGQGGVLWREGRALAREGAQQKPSPRARASPSRSEGEN